MSFQPQLPEIFSPADVRPSPAARPAAHTLPPTAKQMHFAQSLALKTGQKVPDDVAEDRAALSAWIDAHRVRPSSGPFANYPSSKQVAFAERLARLKRRDIPQECFRDKVMMSRWIDGNKPR